MRPADVLSEPARLEQLAEEAAELAHAALKLARFRRGENPTGRCEVELICDLEEELTDVFVAAMELPYRPMKEVELGKRKRWEKRLARAMEEKEGENAEAGMSVRKV